MSLDFNTTPNTNEDPKHVADSMPRDDHSPESFAEIALRLGGASAEEARRTGVVDTADDQVEDLFAPQYQTINSPCAPRGLGSNSSNGVV